MHDLAFAFHFAVDGHQSCAEQLAPLPIADVAPDDYIRRAGFIFERHEHDAAFRVGPLASDDDARDAREPSMRCLRDVLRRHHASGAQLTAQQRERMAAQREAQATIIGDDVLSFAWRWKSR